MDGTPELWTAVSNTLNSDVRKIRRIAGSGVGNAFIVQVQDGRTVFCKTHARPTPGMFRSESDGLDFLRVPDGPRVPQVLAVNDGVGEPCFILLEAIQSTRPDRDGDRRAGEALAVLHCAPSEVQFGYPITNHIGTLEQDNTWSSDWAEFFIERRLAPQIAHAHRCLGRSLRNTLGTVLERARTELRIDEAPCRIHGDLWAGNRLTDENGDIWLIDPAVVHGHREVDLAMMKLFGGFGSACFEAYTSVAPLEPGATQRIGFYQLYFLLVHVNLHGPSWAGQVAQVAWDLS